MIASMNRKIIREKQFISICLMIAVICLISFFRMQMDDERYYDLYSFEYTREETVDFTDGVVNINEGSMNTGDEICRLPVVHLDDGSYIIEVDHEQDTDSRVIVVDGEKEIASFILPASETDTDLSFKTDRDLYNMSALFLYGGGTLTLKHVYLRAQGLFYTDTIVFAVILILTVLILAFIAQKMNIYSLPDRERLFYLAFPAFFLFLNYVFFREHSEVYTTGDAGFLSARIEQTCNELLRGQFPVQIYGDGLNGHGVLGALYPSLFLYFPALLRICHVSMEATLRITFMVVNVATMLTSYLTLKRMTRRRSAAFLGMVVYTTLPYRLGVLLFRSAMGELLAMIFIPPTSSASAVTSPAASLASLDLNFSFSF